jgi:hypothetical protein
LPETAALRLSVAGDDPEDGLPLVGVGGEAILGGTLDIELAAGFVPAAGDGFRLLTSAGGITGQFDTTTFPVLGGGLDWLLDYGANDLILEVIAAVLAGDYSGNGTVEQSDLDLVLLNWGAGATPPPNGWVRDLPTGLVDQDELDAILLNWGAAAQLAPANARVPEPAGVVMLCLSLLIGLPIARGMRPS